MRAPRIAAWLLGLVLTTSAVACEADEGPAVSVGANRGATVLAADPADEELAPLWPDGRGGTVVAETARFRFRIFSSPGGALRQRLWPENPWGQPLRYEVLKAVRSVDGDVWYRVRLPVRPNGSTGWVRGADVRTSRIHERVVVDLSDHVLRRYRRGRLLTTLSVAAGAPVSPTPPGRYFVWAQVAYDDPGGAYGAYALGLSGFSRVLKDWPGGGRLAIHGTADPGDIGRDVSHGCVRVFNPELLAQLTGVPLGTPVLIRP